MAPSRLEAAKRLALADIDEMDSEDVGMVISFSDTARVEQQFTVSQKALRQAVQNIKQTNRTTNMKEALQVASGLANPGRSATDVSDVQVAEAMPAELLIYSDGGLDRVEGFSLGNLTPRYRQIGVATYDDPPETPKGEEAPKRGEVLTWAPNVGIATFTTRRKEGREEQLEAFARLENYGPDDVEVEVELRLDGALVDARRVEIGARDSNGVPFDLGEIREGVLELRAKTSDMLAIDDTAWTVVNPPRRAKVLFVTPGNDPLDFAFNTPRALQIADITYERPSYLETPKYAAEATGTYGLIIYDRCAPKEMPAANTLFIGALPQDKRWEAEAKVVAPQIIDTDRSHPLMHLLELGDVLIAEGTPLKVPQGGAALMDSHVGPMLGIAPRGAFEDAVLAFEIEGEKDYGTNWPVRLSFPVFVMNFLDYLGGSRAAQLATVRPGTPMALQVDIPTESITVTTPDRRSVTVPRGNLGTFNFDETERPGVYAVRHKDRTVQRFAVNLFHPPESDIQPKDLVIGHTEVAGETVREPARREAWKLLLLLGLGVLLFEWYIYNRRVYL
jgi:hypothetical protein